MYNVMCVGRAAAPPVVAGNIQVHSTAWKFLVTTPDTVQWWIENRVSIPFREGPPQPFCRPNPAFTSKQSEFISQEIADLLHAGAIVQCDSANQPVCISPLGCVPKRKGKYRLIVNL